MLVLQPEGSALLEDLGVNVSVVRPDANCIKYNVNSFRIGTSDWILRTW